VSVITTRRDVSQGTRPSRESAGLSGRIEVQQKRHDNLPSSVRSLSEISEAGPEDMEPAVIIFEGSSHKRRATELYANLKEMETAVEEQNSIIKYLGHCRTDMSLENSMCGADDG
jgi:hypothetical protein